MISEKSKITDIFGSLSQKAITDRFSTQHIKEDRRKKLRREDDIRKREFHGRERYVVCARNENGECDSKNAKLNRVTVHGLRGYGGLYKTYAEELSALNYNVVSIDFPGHGKTMDEPCKINHMKDFESCVRSELVVSHKLNPKRKTIVTAFSMGALITLRYLFNSAPKYIKKHIGGVVCIGMPLSVGKDVAQWKISLSPLIAHTIPWWKIEETKMNEDNISHDPEIIKMMLANPMIYKGPLRAWTARAILKMADEVFSLLRDKDLGVPLLCLGGELDETIDSRLYAEVGIPLILFPKFKHEILLGSGTEVVKEYIETWIDTVVLPFWEEKK